jgi:hypothetical protein
MNPLVVTDSLALSLLASALICQFKSAQFTIKVNVTQLKIIQLKIR